MSTIIPGKNPTKPYTVRYRHEGVQRERSFATKREATGFQAKFEHDSREHSFVDPREGKVTFTEYVDGWIANLDRSPNTKASYRSVLVSQLRPHFNGRTLAQVAGDREGVQTFLASLTCGQARKAQCLVVILGAVREL